MEYTTVRDAAQKWGINVRQVQNLCGKGRIPGAVRFGSCWAIPINSPKPPDGRNKTSAEYGKDLKTLKSLHSNEWPVSRFVMYFPYPMLVLTPDGILTMVNDAWQKAFHISDEMAARLIGKYNILKDPRMEKWGTQEIVLRLFGGETVHEKDMKAPLQEISDEFGAGDRVDENRYFDIIAFPVFDDCHKMIYGVVILITSRLYSGKQEIAKGKEYIENHWKEKFDLEAAANASWLSRGHFVKLFKTHTGFTPHNYYLHIKVKMLRDKLMDSNLSISQAFEECGMDYNSHYVGIFKEYSGMTPMEYRKNG
jgi:AraC-like DNA-binding protein